MWNYLVAALHLFDQFFIDRQIFKFVVAESLIETLIHNPNFLFDNLFVYYCVKFLTDRLLSFQ